MSQGQLAALETDRQLLQRYIAEREQSAFTALVRRHEASVRGVCRRVLRHEQDAEDVSQGAFLILARKAGCIPWRSSVRGWLCAVAYRLALSARADTLRQRQREALCGSAAELDTQPAVPSMLPEDAARRELRSLVDQELELLPAKYRAPVVLCYLEGKTNQEAAQLLGWPAGSMSRRLARARELLHERLSRRGLTLLVVLLGLVLAGYGKWLHTPAHLPQASACTTFSHPDTELTLRRLRVDGRADLPAHRLLDMAQQTVAAAQAMQEQPPARQRERWLEFAGQMQRSAQSLAEAVRANNEASIASAAGRLYTSCLQCHATFHQPAGLPVSIGRRIRELDSGLAQAARPAPQTGSCDTRPSQATTPDALKNQRWPATLSPDQRVEVHQHPMPCDPWAIPQIRPNGGREALDALSVGERRA